MLVDMYSRDERDDVSCFFIIHICMMSRRLGRRSSVCLSSEAVSSSVLSRDSRINKMRNISNLRSIKGRSKDKALMEMLITSRSASDVMDGDRS